MDHFVLVQTTAGRSVSQGAQVVQPPTGAGADFQRREPAGGTGSEIRPREPRVYPISRFGRAAGVAVTRLLLCHRLASIVQPPFKTDLPAAVE
jgi:hypothetical protein